MSAFEDPDHPVLPEAWHYEIVAVRIELAPVDGSEPFLDLTVRRGEDRRCLRFSCPQMIEIEPGGPVNGALQILDVSGRQLDGLGVQVTDLEANTGSLQFWARDVVAV